MYCPKCGTESSSDVQYCRLCGANLKVIGKAVSLSEAIARSDRGPLPKIKEMMKSLKIEQVTEDISRALDQMNKEIVHSSDDVMPNKPWSVGGKEEKTAQQRREKHLVSGSISIFSGIGLMIFLYFLAGVLVLKLPPSSSPGCHLKLSRWCGSFGFWALCPPSRAWATSSRVC
ncbi:MAG TPA: zinc ribbon domain-containing protein [Pyrinomonadaceae bacterium]|nr:zinc ribbon domain-containing protein [Pyrinomonadaceae bacterium]